ncbi:DUF5985 family protein [Nitrosomonas communis]|jgi:uncharacterized membrane protein HdeD (DUF308 family)|uniref:Uncharacterized protein n=1 Tax=Nitrosomonas communis TaxID=44574 RepID=A0A1I4KH48_9PROT|nr:DUF5985 family protein [Nitrosomonas communis]SFL77806.1 hypothetical protein SAMN05421863_100447 [Nitrosomonas communis]
MSQLLLGAIAMTNLTIGLFFLRFWKRTHDRFFLFFAVSFTLEGINRVLLGLSSNADENEPVFYLVRLFSFVLILVAIIDKNQINKSQRDN